MKIKIVLSLLVACLFFSVEAKKASSAKAASTASKQAVGKKSLAKGKPASVVQTAHRKIPYVGAIVADAQTGAILFSSGENQPAYPASCTKLMTLLLVMEDVRAGKISLDDLVTATPEVNRCAASWVGIRVGETMSVRDLCLALMVESANDAALVLAVHCSGSVSSFVARMNARASELGMTKTTYYNPNGLPAPRFAAHFNVSTAADQLKLAQAISRIPMVYAFTSVKTCDLVKRPGGYRVSVTRQVGKPKTLTQLAPGESLVKQLRNHNNVMVKDKLKVMNPDGSESVDGFKTGYIDAGGSSVVVTATRNGKRVFVVVLGSATTKDRDRSVRELLASALARFGK